MYSYYTLALLKIPCPWKRYLTQAQLLQFVSVVGYTLLSYSKQPADTIVAPFLVQIFEMVSLLVLFLHFYRKAYRSKQESKRRAYTVSTASVSVKVTDMMDSEQCEDEPDTVSSTSSEGVSSDDGDE